MKLYSCDKCQNLLYFENTVCLNCRSAVGFDAGSLSMVTLLPSNEKTFTDINNKNQSWRYCDNAAYAACNWIIPASQTDGFCMACDLNRTIPSLDKEENLDRWRRIEIAKHRLIYSLLRLRLPVESKEGEEETGIAFDFMADTDPVKKVMTGHDSGTITLNIEEADEKLRVKHKLDLGERYRTLLGHFRHEIGHYYWDVFFKNNNAGLQKFRKLFGDDSIDYSEALKKYYETGAPADWNNHFISPYAAAHAWEDWAETWAHFLHMMDTLETAYSFGIAVNPRKANDGQQMQANISRDPYTISNFDEIVKMWLPLTFAVNSLNRSMGHQDFYPFIISAAVIEKLRFIHEQVKNYGAGKPGIRN
ncbi:MAG TPA: putative zinc-binding peptidase [Chitinophagaceae bacterium]|nr:putative zinc-binding peptidase [Chitinophagaceae bacterium]